MYKLLSILEYDGVTLDISNIVSIIYVIKNDIIPLNNLQNINFESLKPLLYITEYI